MITTCETTWRKNREKPVPPILRLTLATLGFAQDFFPTTTRVSSWPKPRALTRSHFADPDCLLILWYRDLTDQIPPKTDGILKTAATLRLRRIAGRSGIVRTPTLFVGV